MSRSLLAALVAARLALAPALLAAQDYPLQPAAGPPKPFKVPASESFRLPNGMDVTLIPFGAVPKTVVSLQVSAGNLNEGEQVWLSTLTGQMLREGSGGRSGAQIAAQAAAMGGNLGVFPSTHQTFFNLYVLSEHAADAVRLVGEVARRPTFPASELERVRQNLARSLAVARSQPQPAADAALAAAYYGTSHPYGRPFPSDAQLKGYTLADVQHFYVANFGARRARLYVAGRFDAAAVRAAIQQSFADWEPGPEPLRLPPSPRPGPQLILVDRPGASQSTIRLAYPAPLAGSPGDIPFQVMDALLGGSFTSRITSNIREQKGYTYSPSSNIEFNPAQSVWEFDADVTTEVTGPALKEVFGEIRRMQTEPIPEADAGGMRTWMAGTFVLRNAGPAGLVGSLAERDFHGLPADWLDGYVPSVLAVTAADMQRLAREELPLERMTLVVVGDLAKVRPQLEALPELKGIAPKLVNPFGP